MPRLTIVLIYLSSGRKKTIPIDNLQADLTKERNHKYIVILNPTPRLRLRLSVAASSSWILAEFRKLDDSAPFPNLEPGEAGSPNTLELVLLKSCTHSCSLLD